MGFYSDYHRAEELDQDDEAEIKALLIGSKVMKVTENKLLLDDGTVLEVEANVGCGGCSSGNYDLTDLNGVDNVITDVALDVRDNPDDGGYSTIYSIFVYAENQQITLLESTGDDGNGYYGSGYRIFVRK